jgi:hypothetical protein
MWLPLWLYQLLPIIYLLAGLLMLANFGSEPLGLVSGSMLCAAGLLILVLRIYWANKTSTRER